MTLGEQQRLFAKLVGKLIDRIYEQGYEVSLDWCYRPPEVAAYYASTGVGVRSSLHTSRLAIDLNLFKDGAYLSASEDHRAFGEWWCTQHELCRWGGNFTTRKDGNHYSMEWGGVQ